MIATRAQVKSRFLALLDDASGKVFLNHTGGPSYTVTAASVSGGNVTLTIGTHSIAAGQQVTVSGIVSSSGSMNAPEVTVGSVGATTITYPITGSPTYVSGGTVTTGSCPFDEAFGEAYDAMFQAFLVGQVPRIKQILIIGVGGTGSPFVAGTTSLTPASVGITDFADYVELRERLSGSTELWRRLESREQLTQRVQTDRLLEFVWREDTFYFIGATTNRDLELTYETSGTAPTSDSTSIGVDGCLTFLANYAAGVAGQRKGYDEIAQRCWNLAVGSRYNDGILGGELFRITQARVRSEQKTQIAPRPFTTVRRGWPMWRAPYIAAQQPQGTGMAPSQFTTADGTITPTPNGSTTQFFLAYPVSTVAVYLNGDLMTKGVDYTAGANVVTFLPGQVPQSGDLVTVEGWV